MLPLDCLGLPSMKQNSQFSDTNSIQEKNFARAMWNAKLGGSTLFALARLVLNPALREILAGKPPSALHHPLNYSLILSCLDRSVSLSGVILQGVSTEIPYSATRLTAATVTYLP